MVDKEKEFSKAFGNLPKIVKEVKDWKLHLSVLRAKGESLGFVPTMGALHEGHLSLIQRSLRENDWTVVSVFVNPTQFNEEEDFKNYPIQREKDLEYLKSHKVPFLFLPDVSKIYEEGFVFQVQEKDLSRKLCGTHRKGHFEGVLTVVLKLLNIMQPDRAYFGEKDYQQCLLIQNMVKAFFLDVQIILCPTVREKNGLAMSSRNLRLTKEEKEQASFFYKILQLKEKLSFVQKRLEEKGFEVEYVEEREGRRFGAVKIRNIRLIDNVPLSQF